MAKYSFDEAFLSAMKHQQELNLERDKLKQNISFNYRQLTLLDNYRQDRLKQDENQFQQTFEARQDTANRDYELDKQRLQLGQDELAERQANNAANQKYRYDALEQDRKYKYDALRQEKELNENDLAYKKSLIDMPKPAKKIDISSEVGKVTSLLTNKYNNQAGEDWQSKTKGALEELLTKVGVPLNNAFVTNFGKRITGANAEEKLKSSKNILRQLSQDPELQLTPEQRQALDLYGQYKALLNEEDKTLPPEEKKSVLPNKSLLPPPAEPNDTTKLDNQKSYLGKVFSDENARNWIKFLEHKGDLYWSLYNDPHLESLYYNLYNNPNGFELDKLKGYLNPDTYLKLFLGDNYKYFGKDMKKFLGD